MVTSALWVDIEANGWPDLFLAGEWMPLTLLKNDQGSLKTANIPAFENSTGWWNSLASIDIDQDGDLDFIAGNLGLNNPFQPTPQEPLYIFAKDYDENGTRDPIMAYYIEGELHIAHPRDAINSQIVAMKKRFVNYHDFAMAKFDGIFYPKEREGAYELKVETLASHWIENDGKGGFTLHELPHEVQYAPLNGILPQDVDGDGFTDVILHGNDFGTQVGIGPYDGHSGLILKMESSGGLKSMPSEETGWNVTGDARALIRLFVDNQPVFMASQNNDSLKSFLLSSSSSKQAIFTPNHTDQLARLHFTDGSVSFRQKRMLKLL